MEKGEKIYEMMSELGKLLGQMTRENTQLLEFVREKNLLLAFEEYKKRDDAARQAEKVKNYYGVVDEGDIVPEEELQDREEVVVCPAHMILSWRTEEN